MLSTWSSAGTMEAYCTPVMTVAVAVAVAKAVAVARRLRLYGGSSGGYDGCDGDGARA